MEIQSFGYEKVEIMHFTIPKIDGLESFHGKSIARKGAERREKKAEIQSFGCKKVEIPHFAIHKIDGSESFRGKSTTLKENAWE